MSSTNNDLQMDMVEYVENAGGALHQASKLAAAVEQEKQAALQRVEPLLDSLIDAHLVPDHSRQEAMSKLASHAGALEIIGNLKDYVGQVKAAYEQKLTVASGGGKPVSDHEKAASADNQPVSQPVVVGSRAGLGERRGSDVSLLKLAGLM